ncbi:unnamed protein product [Schistosoma margrebowiei]|uniref:Uncharacterized protein n=1 Tax=Schistosoma margrebowiei TaxID=48269 RepID=A0A183MIV5_9TREM|nr:unnamed protein product [Schistosoma margrebowiei]
MPANPQRIQIRLVDEDQPVKELENLYIKVDLRDYFIVEIIVQRPNCDTTDHRRTSLEWNSSLYINFNDYEKAFDSVDRRTLWKLLRHDGVSEKIVTIIRNSYDGLQCKVVHGGQGGLDADIKARIGKARVACLQLNNI